MSESSAASVETTERPADTARGTKPTLPPADGTKVTIVQVTVIAETAIAKALSKERQPTTIPVSTRNTTSPTASPIHGTLA